MQVPLILAGVISITTLGLIALWIFKQRTNTNSLGNMPTARTTGPTRPSGVLATPCVKLEFQPVELYLGKSEDAPVVTFSALKARDLTPNKRPVDLSNTKLGALNPLLQLIPPILTAAEFGGGKYMRVVVNGSLAVAGDAHSYLPFVRGANGKVTELARLQDIGPLSQVLNAAIVWQFASVIVAQKHLADISKKLNEIKKGIDDVKAFLENGRKSTITGNLRYLDQAVQAIMQGEFPETVRDQLEHMERQLLQIQNHLGEDLRALTNGIPQIEHSDVVGTRKLTQNIEEHQGHLYEVQQQLILCIRARVANWQVLSAFPGEEHIKTIRKDDILKSVDEFTGHISGMDEPMQKKIAEISSVLNRPETLLQRQGKLKRNFREYEGRISSSNNMIRAQVAEIADRILSLQKPMVLALKIKQGQLLEA